MTQLLPVLVFGLLGGSTADRIDRRRLLFYAEIIMCLGALGLLVNALLSTPSVVAIFVFTLLMQSANAYHRPSMEAMAQKMVDVEDYAAIGALGSLRYSMGAILGPITGGWILAEWGAVGAYAVDVLSFFIALVSVTMISQSYQSDQKSTNTPWQDIRDGMQFAIQNPALLGTYIVDIVAMTFAFPVALFPAMAPQWGDSKVLGWLYGGMAIGSLIITLFSGRASQVQHRGRMVVLAAAAWGLAIIGFGATQQFMVAMVFLILAGATDMVSGLYRGVIWNEVIPNHMRGRLAGIEMISYMTGPLLGNFRAGTMAAWVGTSTAITSGGIICFLGVVICGFFLRPFWNYRPAPIQNPDAGNASS